MEWGQRECGDWAVGLRGRGTFLIITFYIALTLRTMTIFHTLKEYIST